MAIEIVHGTPHMIWCPLINTDTVYVGQIVRVGNEGVHPITSAVGASNKAYNVQQLAVDNDGGATAHNNTPFGVCVGTNLKTPAYNSTVQAEGAVYLSPASATAETYVGVEGPWAKGDRQAMVKVAVIMPTTVLRAPLYNAALGTAPTLLTVTTAGTAGCTTNATSFTPIAGEATFYHRTGAQAGAYRIRTDTSTTVATWDVPLNATNAVGDTAVSVQLRPQGRSRVQFDSEAMYINVGADISTNYWSINVLRLDLAVAGKEYVEFCFDVSQLGMSHTTS